MFFRALGKLTNRKKRNGYYEASDILTSQEKQSLIIAGVSFTVPLLITSLMILINM